MKTSKRITSLMVALVFALTSMMSFTVFADEPAFSDVSETQSYYSAISNLVAKGIINGYEDGTFKPEATITRAEFAKILAVATAPAGTKFEATTTQFPDVADASSSSAWAIPYIAYAVGIKAINGYDDGTFRPTSPVSYGEAVKMIVCTMGYGDVVDKTLEPWYMGYVNIANSIGLTKSAYLNGAQPAPRGIVAQLTYNIEFCNKLNNSGFTDSGENIYQTGNEWDNSESHTGKLLGVFEYSLTGKALSKTDVLIGDTVYDIGDFDVKTLKDMVGNTVSYKVSTIGRKTLTSIVKESGANSSLSIEDWQIEEVDEGYIKYYEDEEDKADSESTKITLSENLYVVYNGVPVRPENIDADFIEEYLDVENGNITFISNDSSPSSAEVAIVESYVTYYVGSKSKLNGVVSIYDKYPSITGLQKLEFDEHDISSVKRITSKDGSYTDTTIDAISQKNVVSVAQPYSTAEGTNVIISAAVVTGSIKEMSDDYEYVKIGTETFTVAPYYRTILAGGEEVDFTIGDSGKFYLDYQGRIVTFEKTESETPYGLLIRYNHGSGIGAEYFVEIFTSSGDFLQYPLKDTIRLNGNSVSAQTAINHFQGTRSPSIDWELTDENPDEYLIQPVRYKTVVLNGKTYFSEIECMDPSNDYQDGLIVPDYPSIDNFESGTPGKNLTYSKSGFFFQDDGVNKFAMGQKTVLFVVPSDITKSDSYRKGNYTYSFNEKNESGYRVEAYNVESMNAEVVIFYNTNSEDPDAKIKPATYTYFINSVVPATYKEQDTKMVTFYRAGDAEPDTKYIKDDVKVSDFDYNPDDLKAGDVVKMSVSGDYITNIGAVYVDGELLPDTGEGGEYEIDGHYIKGDNSSTEDYYQAMLGVVYQIEGTSLRVVPAFMDDDNFDAEGLLRGLTLSSSVKYYKYSTKTNGFEPGSVGDIMQYAEMSDEAKGDSTTILAIGREKKITAILIVE